MKLWLLERVNKPSWDEFGAKIVRAPTEARARELANLKTGDEGKLWHDRCQVRCAILSTAGYEGEILGSFKAG